MRTKSKDQRFLFEELAPKVYNPGSYDPYQWCGFGCPDKHDNLIVHMPNGMIVQACKECYERESLNYNSNNR